jgi:hypothetical protein
MSLGGRFKGSRLPRFEAPWRIRAVAEADGKPLNMQRFQGRTSMNFHKQCPADAAQSRADCEAGGERANAKGRRRSRGLLPADRMNHFYEDPQQVSLPSLDCVIETVRPFSFAGAQVNEGTLPERLRFAVLNNWRHVRDRAEACLCLD